MQWLLVCITMTSFWLLNLLSWVHVVCVSLEGVSLVASSGSLCVGWWCFHLSYVTQQSLFESDQLVHLLTSIYPPDTVQRRSTTFNQIKFSCDFPVTNSKYLIFFNMNIRHETDETERETECLYKSALFDQIWCKTVMHRQCV